MKTRLIPFLGALIGFSLGVYSQKSYDRSFQFPSGPGNPQHNYSLYIPKGYSETKPSKLLLGFHPVDADAKNWRDTLIYLAESQNLLLAVPDGGFNHKIDDSIDFEFTSALIDSMKFWYNVDQEQIFGLGFSLGGKALYEYGLSHPNVFKGYIPVASSMEGTGSIDGILHNAKCRNFYLVHGDKDSPTTRFFPVKAALISKGARLDFIYMAGIGNTFDLPGKNTILKTAFNFVDTASCDYTAVPELRSESMEVYPTSVSAGERIRIQFASHLELLSVSLYDAGGREAEIEYGQLNHGEMTLQTVGLSRGIYILRLQFREAFRTTMLVIK